MPATASKSSFGSGKPYFSQMSHTVGGMTGGGGSNSGGGGGGGY